MRRRNVRAFIKADAAEFIIHRHEAPTKSLAGGMVAGAILDLPPQEGRLVLNKRRFNAGLVNSEAGEIPHTDYLLIMEYNKDVAQDDEFEYNGNYFTVTGIFGNRVESFLCSVEFRGPKNRDA